MWLWTQNLAMEKVLLWPQNLAMKKSRYGRKISLWKNLAIKNLAMKSRYTQISLWKSRYEKISLWNLVLWKMVWKLLWKNNPTVWKHHVRFFLKDFKHFGKPTGWCRLFRRVFATALESPGGNFRGSFHTSFHTNSRLDKSRYKISLWNLAMNNKSRYEKISLWPQNLAMKKSRYAQKISLWKNLAMTTKSRYEKISLWTDLAMEKSRYEIVL